MKTSKFRSGFYFIVAMSILFQLALKSVKAQTVSDATTLVYGLNSTGLIYPINTTTATRGTALNSSGTVNTPGGLSSPNGIGYASINSRFYYYWKNPSSANPGTFVSFNPATKAYETLSTVNAPMNPIRSGSVTADGKYFCLDVTGKIYSYTISTNTWTLITDNLVDQDGNDVDAIVRTYNTGDMAFDGLGNLWIVVSGKPSGSLSTSKSKIGLYKLNAPFANTSVSSFTVTRMISTTESTPDGYSALGIAFNMAGEIYVSTSFNLYLFDPSTKAFVPKGSVSDVQDLTSTSYPMNVMPVKWVGFNAEAGNKNQVLLTWEVTDQVDNKGFSVQYSSDQRKWDDVTFIDSKSSGGKNEKYSYIYTGILSSENYFRIKQVDIDGKFSYSQIKSMRLAKQVSSVESNIVIYPNPVRDVMNITNLESSNYTARIVDMSGRVIKSFVMRNGQNQVDVASLKSGIYFISMNDMNGKVNSAKMVKL